MLLHREHDVALPDPPAKAKLSEFAASVSDKSKLFPIHSPEIEKYVNPHAVANMEATPETLASSSATITEQDSGMAIIIKLLSDAWEMQKKKSEVEIRNRLRQKNERLADAALKFTAYKNILFRTLVESKKAQVCLKCILIQYLTQCTFPCFYF